MVKVPEAYLLISRLDVMKPGLVMLDPDGRQAGVLSLLGALKGKIEPSEVTAFLEKAAKAPVTERFLVEGKEASLEKLRAAVAAREGIAKAEILKGGTLALTVAPGALAPPALEKLCAGIDKAMRVIQPVECEPRPTHTEANPVHLDRVPGLWYHDFQSASRAWLPRMLLHPSAWKDSGLTSNLVAKRFTFHSLPKGAQGFALANSVTKVPGVLAVFPEVFDDALTVVGNDRVFDAAKAAAVLTAAGHEPDDEDDDDDE